MALQLDKALINIRVDVIDKNLREIKAIVGEGEDRFLKDYRNTLAGKHALLESIEACIDIGNHIIASLGLRRPEDYKDVFAVLEEKCILSSSLSEKLQNMAKFRNLLVHFYTKVDDRKVFAIMKRNAGDMRYFAKAVLGFTAKKHS